MFASCSARASRLGVASWKSLCSVLSRVRSISESCVSSDGGDMTLFIASLTTSLMNASFSSLDLRPNHAPDSWIRPL
jgi:hypothetical protein